MMPPRPRFQGLAGALAALLGLVACDRIVEAPPSRSVRVEALSVLDAPRETAQLRLVAALALDSDDPAFGGFSGMALSDDGTRLMAVSDRGQWLSLGLVHDRGGRLHDVGDASMGPLRDVLGKPVRGRMLHDAEELVDLGDAWLVGFEGGHRMWRYAKGTHGPGIASLPTPVPHPRGLQRAAKNGGLEAMVSLGDRLLILTEGLLVHGAVRGWISDPGKRWRTLDLEPTDSFAPTGLARLPDGDLLLLERSYTAETGVRIRLSRHLASSLSAGTPLRGEELARMDLSWPIDNFESVAARRSSSGAVSIYLLSDDNFSSDQRTLLLQLHLAPF